MTILQTQFAYTEQSNLTYTYPEARQLCKDIGMELPMFKTQEEYSALTDIVDGKQSPCAHSLINFKLFFVDPVWTGLLNPDRNNCEWAACDNQFIWDDGLSTPFQWQSYYTFGLKVVNGPDCFRLQTNKEIVGNFCGGVGTKRQYRCTLKCV